MLKSFKKKRAEKKFNKYIENISFYEPKKGNYHDVKDYRKMGNRAHLLDMPDLVKQAEFLDAFKDIKVQYATSGNATVLKGSANFHYFVKEVMPIDNGKYVFHNIVKDQDANKILPKIIPIPKFIPAKKISDLRISRLFAGAKYSGTHIHIHSGALNYLVSGKKLWVMFPYSDHNNAFADRNKYKYKEVKGTAIEWFMEAYEKLTEPGAVEDLCIFIQNESEIVYVPPGNHHAVINLEDSLGITYSWN